MRKMINLNDHYVDTNKVSFIGKVDTVVKAHLGVQWYFFSVVVDGKEVDIIADKKEQAVKLRNELIHECGASVPQGQQGLLPS